MHSERVYSIYIECISQSVYMYIYIECIMSIMLHITNVQRCNMPSAGIGIGANSTYNRPQHNKDAFHLPAWFAIRHLPCICILCIMYTNIASFCCYCCYVYCFCYLLGLVHLCSGKLRCAIYTKERESAVITPQLPQRHGTISTVASDGCSKTDPSYV